MSNTDIHMYDVFQGFRCHCCLLRCQVLLVSVKHLEKFCELRRVKWKQTAFPYCAEFLLT